MYEELKTKIATLITRTRPIKPQTERQLSRYLTESSSELEEFLREAPKRLEEHELEVVFSPQFTPEWEDQVAVSDLLYHWRPSREELDRLTRELTGQLTTTILELPGQIEAELTLDEVMIERFVRLLRMDNAPDPSISAQIREALACEFWADATALMRQRGFYPDQQHWFARFVDHMAMHHRVTVDQLHALAQFIAEQRALDRDSLREAIQSLLQATRQSVTYAQSGRAYWSPDVAQHHHYQGQGQVDQNLVQERQDELAQLEVIQLDLETFESGPND